MLLSDWINYIINFSNTTGWKVYFSAAFRWLCHDLATQENYYPARAQLYVVQEKQTAQRSCYPSAAIPACKHFGIPVKKLSFAAFGVYIQKEPPCKCDSGWGLLSRDVANSWIMMCMGSFDEGCGGRWLKALAGGSHRFLLDGDSFQALYGRFFSHLICSLSYFSHFLWLIYHCFEFFLWECSQHPAMNKCKWLFMVCGKWLSIFFNSLQWWEYFWSVRMFFQNIFSGYINHLIGHRVSFKGVWASFSVGHMEPEVHITAGWIWGLAWFFVGFWLVVVWGFFPLWETWPKI